jgi:hypothetical protein
MFKVKGTIRGRAVEVTWNDGRLEGDELAVQVVESEAALYDGHELGPVCGPFTTEDHLSDPLGAVFVLLAIFDEGAEFSGDVPEAPETEEGAIP